MNVSISTNDRRCPPLQPIAIINTETGELVGCYRSMAAAEKAKEILEAPRPPVAASTSPTFAW